MTITIRALSGTFVGEVSGVDTAHPLAPDAVAAIEAGMDAYAVLIFHDQHITDEQQMIFSANFGPLLEGANSTLKRDELRLHPAFADVSNIDKDGSLLAADDRRRIAALGNRLWHSDASFRVVPARYSLLSGRIVPPHGGNTQFADMRNAYAALDDATRAQIADLVCEHSQVFSRAQLGFSDYLPHERETMAPVLHRLVREHPATARKSIYLSAHIGTIVGWRVPEALAFIRDLSEHATQREFVHSHSWRAGDLVMWDNRCTMHRARSYDDLNYRRDLRRTTTRAEGPTVEQRAA